MKFDYGQRQFYRFYVDASDHGTDPKWSQTLVTSIIGFVCTEFWFTIIFIKDLYYKTFLRTILNITDINDNSPTFNVTGFSFNVMENQLPNTFVGKLTAYDLDDGKIAYHGILMKITVSSCYLGYKSSRWTVF
jgi:hypothetical protein